MYAVQYITLLLWKMVSWSCTPGILQALMQREQAAWVKKLTSSLISLLRRLHGSAAPVDSYMDWEQMKTCLKLALTTQDVSWHNIPVSYWSRLQCWCWPAGPLADHSLPQTLHELIDTWWTQHSPADHHHSNHIYRKFRRFIFINSSQMTEQVVTLWEL